MDTTTGLPIPGGDEGGLTIEISGHVMLLGLDRPDKRNALTPKMLADIATAYSQYEADENLRCAVLFGHGKVFCAGFDLTAVQASVGDDRVSTAEGYFDPFQLEGATLSKPVIVAVHGMCFAGGMEIALAGDIIVAAEGTKVGQPETSRGLFAFGGGAVRWPQRVGWGNAQRYLLTGEALTAEEALRIGLVQEVVSADMLGDRALQLAQSIAAAAPIGVRDNLAVGRKAAEEGQLAAFAEMAVRRSAIVNTADAAEGIASFLERRSARYVGE